MIKKRFPTILRYFFKKSLPIFHRESSFEEYEALLERVGTKNLFPMERKEVLEKMFLKLLEPEEAKFLSRFPCGLIHESEIEKKYKKDFSKQKLDEMIKNVHEKAFICELEFGGEIFYMMRDPDDKFPLKELAELSHEYFVHTYMGEMGDPKKRLKAMRVLSNEQVMPENVEILDYESARKVIENASSIAVGNCQCRACYDQMYPENKINQKYPLKTCMNFNAHAESLMKHGMGERLTVEEGLELLDECVDLGLMQQSDNTINPIFMCNCERESCYLLNSYNMGGHKYFFSKSRFIAEKDDELCNGCGACVKSCPIYLHKKGEGKKPSFDQEECIGCGVCAYKCPTGALYLVEREDWEESYVPFDFVDYVAEYAREKMIFHNLVFNDTEKLLHKIMNPVFKGFERSFLGKFVFGRESVMNLVKKKARREVLGYNPIKKK